MKIEYDLEWEKKKETTCRWEKRETKTSKLCKDTKQGDLFFGEDKQPYFMWQLRTYWSEIGFWNPPRTCSLFLIPQSCSWGLVQKTKNSLKLPVLNQSPGPGNLEIKQEPSRAHLEYVTYRRQVKKLRKINGKRKKTAVFSCSEIWNPIFLFVCMYKVCILMKDQMSLSWSLDWTMDSWLDGWCQRLNRQLMQMDGRLNERVNGRQKNEQKKESRSNRSVWPSCMHRGATAPASTCQRPWLMTRRPCSFPLNLPKYTHLHAPTSAVPLTPHPINLMHTGRLTWHETP